MDSTGDALAAGAPAVAQAGTLAGNTGGAPIAVAAPTTAVERTMEQEVAELATTSTSFTEACGRLMALIARRGIQMREVTPLVQLLADRFESLSAKATVSTPTPVSTAAASDTDMGSTNSPPVQGAASNGSMTGAGADGGPTVAAPAAVEDEEPRVLTTQETAAAPSSRDRSVS